MRVGTRTTEAVLARMINSYWRERGFNAIKAIVADVVEETAYGGTTRYQAVRSNLGPHGFPPSAFIS